MTAHKAYFHVIAHVELPDDDAAADARFDEICDAVVETVRHAGGVYDESVSMGDADTVTE